ncbi:MAG TPA: IS630 family transposase [Bacteroidota bacterium]|nr:IS630 family transposase [Bacteroidota bacterium]
MEKILKTYEKPYNLNEPVMCFDEKPVQLLSDSRKPLLMRPGTIKKTDSEYVRKGTANIFVTVEPKAGNHYLYVTRNKTGNEFAKVIKRLSEKYPNAKTIHLVMDNYGTHTLKSLTNVFGSFQGKRIWRKFTVHYTPNHASWLNQAEIGISMVSKQCLGKSRTGDFDTLRNKVNAWQKKANKKKMKIHWKFTTKKAREKFKY